MNDFRIGRHRSVPPHAPGAQANAGADNPQNKDPQRDAAPEDTSQNNASQHPAAAAPDVQLHAHEPDHEPQPHPTPLPIEAYTISVDQVREHFRAKGVTKSKDTVQRWCRTGELDCQKRGVLGRYFTTEPSLKALEEKLLPDMIAENVGGTSLPDAHIQPDADSGAQVHAAEAPAALDSMPVQTAAGEDARSDLQLHPAEVAEERSEVQPHEAADAAARSDVPEQTPRRVPVMPAGASDPRQQASAARLEAEVEGLRAQLENRDQQIAFLQEEIRSARDQRSAVVQISNRMLETLETMAIGGRLERRTGQTEPLRHSTDRPPVHSQVPETDRVY